MKQTCAKLYFRAIILGPWSKFMILFGDLKIVHVFTSVRVIKFN